MSFIMSIDVCSPKKSCEIKADERKKIIQRLTELDLEISALESTGKAMRTAGGVSTREISPRTMKSRLVNGLYFAGEVIDVDGDSSGYNLQFAFSSAWTVAKSICSPEERSTSKQKNKNVDA